MITRVTENMKFNTITNNLFNAQGKSAELMEKISSEKMINRPSDNPIGASNVLNYRSAMASIAQYQTNITNAKTWLSLTDTNLSGIKDIVSQARDISVSQSSSVASNETMDANASVLSSLIDDALSLLNTKQGDSYLFGGSKTDVAPFSPTPVGSIGDATAAPVNNFDGTVTSGGTYMGTGDNTYLVEIVNGGTLNAATYKISADGGKTWGGVQNFPPQEVKGQMANTESGSPITAATCWSNIDGANVQSLDSFTITGKKHNGDAVAGSYTIADAGTGTVQDLLHQIETTFSGTVTATIDTAGRITVTDNTTGDSQLAMTLVANNESGGTLDFGAVTATTTKTITLGDGITTTFTPNTKNLAANDSFMVNAGATSIGTATAALNGGLLTFDGTVTSGGTYTGTVNKTYAVKIINAGVAPDLSDAQYQVSDDGGITWGVTQTDLSQPIDFVDGLGVTMTFVPGVNPLHAGDSFTVNAIGSIGDATAAPVNAFDGTVTSSGTYTGTVNKTYAVKIINGGTAHDLSDASYQVSDDGGITWGATQTGLSSQITLGEGIKMNFTPTVGAHTLTADDSFTVNAIATSFDAASAATANTFNGTVASSGTYTGTENKSYAVKVITGGTLVAATYKISADGGKTWAAEQNFPPQEVKGQVANTAWSSPITAATAWNEIDGANVQDNTSFTITGKTHDGTIVAGTYTITNAAMGTVQDLLNQIDTTFGGTATASIDADGKITMTDTTAGASQMEMTLVTNNQPGGTLDFGTVNATTTKTITLGDGITTTFTPNTQNLAANDLFTVNTYAAGYYRGDNENLTVQIGKGNNLVYNITGSSAFTAANGPVATASLTTGTGTTLTKDDTIMLTRGATAGSWTLTNHANYPNMSIKTDSADKVTIDADGHGTDVITLSLSGEWNASDTASFSITGGKVSPNVAVHGPGAVDLLTTLNALKSALEAHDITSISAQTDDLNNIQTQVLEKQTEAGSKTNSLDLASSNLTALNEQITSMKSSIEDIDQAKIITSFQMQQIALQASYNLAAQIGKMTILDYLR